LSVWPTRWVKLCQRVCCGGCAVWCGQDGRIVHPREPQGCWQYSMVSYATPSPALSSALVAVVVSVAARRPGRQWLGTAGLPAACGESRGRPAPLHIRPTLADSWSVVICQLQAARTSAVQSTVANPSRPVLIDRRKRAVRTSGRRTRWPLCKAVLSSHGGLNDLMPPGTLSGCLTLDAIVTAGGCSTLQLANDDGRVQCSHTLQL
jgi:hypothetical protein